MKIQVNKVSYVAGGKRILDNVSFALQERGVLAILGENGSGKSTLIEIISGLIKPSNGFVSYDNGKNTYRSG